MIKDDNVVKFDMGQFDRFIAEKDGVVRNELLSQFDRQLIEHCLKRFNNNQTVVASVLGINRITLRTRIKNLGIRVGD